MRKRPEMLNHTRRSLWDSVIVIACAVLMALLLFNFWFIREYLVVTVDGGSMMDTLRHGDTVYAATSRTPKRGDIVIIDVTDYESFQSVYANADGRRIIIKRLIAVEGDVIKCEKGVVYLKKAGEAEFHAFDESYVSENYRTPDFHEINVGIGEIFVLGDHRDNSHDSEDAGCLKCRDIFGVVPEWSIEYRRQIGFFEKLRFAFKN